MVLRVFLYHRETGEKPKGKAHNYPGDTRQSSRWQHWSVRMKERFAPAGAKQYLESLNAQKEYQMQTLQDSQSKSHAQ